MARYCVGPTMAIDWGDDDDAPGAGDPGLLSRVFGYFAPWWRQGVVVVVVVAAAACIAAEPVLGLAPAVVFRALIDYLGRRAGIWATWCCWSGAGVGAALAGA